MALTSSNLSAEPRAISVGPLKMQIKTFSAASADTTGTVTFDRLSSVQFVIVSGLTQTAQPTYATNVATLAFVDPAATVHGQIIAFGK